MEYRHGTKFAQGCFVLKREREREREREKK